MVKPMKKEKALGLDGIQAEAPQGMIKFSCNNLCDMLNAFRASNDLSKKVNTRVIKLIPKGGDKLKTRNYRPLTMLEFMNKVMAKALANSIKGLVGHITHSKQFGECAGKKHTCGYHEFYHLNRLDFRAKGGECDNQYGLGEGI